VVELGSAGDSAPDALRALPGIVGISGRGEGRYLLEHVAGSDPREGVFRLAVERGWVLLALTPQQASLEDVFVRLTTREDEMVPAAAEEVHDA
jgi:ABC-2 type transport system ATP-binding protein